MDGDLNHLVNSAVLRRVEHTSAPQMIRPHPVFTIPEDHNITLDPYQGSPVTNYPTSERSFTLTDFGPSPQSSESWATSLTLVDPADGLAFGFSPFLMTGGAVPPPPPFLPEIRNVAEVVDTPQREPTSQLHSVISRRSLKRSRRGRQIQIDSPGSQECQPAPIPPPWSASALDPWLLSMPIHGSPSHVAGARTLAQPIHVLEYTPIAMEATSVTSDMPEEAGAAYQYLLAQSVHSSIPFAPFLDFPGTESDTLGALAPGVRFVGPGPALPATHSDSAKTSGATPISVAGSSGMSELDTLEGDAFDFDQYVNQLANGYFVMDED